MELPRLGVKSELQLQATATATATPDSSRVCNLHRSSQQCRILNPLSEARDRTCIPMDTSRVHNLLSHNGKSWLSTFKLQLVNSSISNLTHSLMKSDLEEVKSICGSFLHPRHSGPALTGAGISVPPESLLQPQAALRNLAQSTSY